MEQLHTSTVTPEQIDHLGHMNVRFYAVLARAGAQELAHELGLAAGGDVALWENDTYVRHHREQLSGARLVVNGGVLDADARRVRIYEELANRDTGQLAATFVLTLSPVVSGARTDTNFDEEAVGRALDRLVDVPDHGRSRSISFDDDPIATAPSLDVLRERDLAMREVRTIADFECDADGWYRSELLADLVWGGAVVNGRSFQPFHTDPEGRTLGWATMETRSTWGRLPREGDRVQSFGAELNLAAKTMTSGNWVHDVDRDELVCAFSLVNLAFDLESRRSVAIPEALREAVGPRLHPDLA